MLPCRRMINPLRCLVILYTRHRQPHVLLIQRSEQLRLHAGEISFPGGFYEEAGRHPADHGPARNPGRAGPGYTGVSGAGPPAHRSDAHRICDIPLSSPFSINCRHTAKIRTKFKKCWKFLSCLYSPRTTRKWAIPHKNKWLLIGTWSTVFGVPRLKSYTRSEDWIRGTKRPLPDKRIPLKLAH